MKPQFYFSIFLSSILLSTRRALQTTNFGERTLANVVVIVTSIHLLALNTTSFLNRLRDPRLSSQFLYLFLPLKKHGRVDPRSKLGELDVAHVMLL